MFILVMATATFAGTGLTTTVQNRIARVEVVDNNIYNVTVLSQTDRFISTRTMAQKSGTFVIEIPEGSDYIEVIATNILTGATEVITLRAE